ncbi:Uncharacterised protein [Mycobacteroides abscessus subsp. abscessus]|nr:Uncharacterised protein [Mycobacteroides abscessus subsp. abscessus]
MFLRVSAPVWMICPSASTALIRATWSPVTPYLAQQAPPALVARLPPMVEIARLPGSGTYHSPSSSTAAARSPLSTPASTVAVRARTSMSSIRFIRSVLRTMPPSSALAPPAKPVPAPLVTNGTAYRCAVRVVATTSWVVSARTTAIGRPDGVSTEWSRV